MAAGLIPGVVYGNDDDGNVLKTMVTIPEKVLRREIRLHGLSFENTPYELIVKRAKNTDQQVDNKSAQKKSKDDVKEPVELVEIGRYIAIPRQAQFNPGKSCRVKFFLP